MYACMCIYIDIYIYVYVCVDVHQSTEQTTEELENIDTTERERLPGRQAHLQHVRGGEMALCMETKEHQCREAAHGTDANTRAPMQRRKESERENMLAVPHAHDFLGQEVARGRHSRNRAPLSQGEG